jgi:periplasmic protein TonB
MISLRSGASISATVLLHVILAFLFMLGLMEHTITPPEAPPVLVELMQSQPTPKTIEQPVAKPIPVPPRPQPVAAPAPTPQPQPIPSKVSTPTEVAQAAPVAPVSAPTAPTPPAPTRAEASPTPAPPSPAPVVTAPSKTDVSIPASYSASNQKPIYPNMSKRLGEQGTVVLRVLVKADGSAGEVEVKSSSNYPRLDQAAIDAVKTWRFNPAKIDGKATDEWYQVPIPFKLQSSSN